MHYLKSLLPAIILILSYGVFIVVAKGAIPDPDRLLTDFGSIYEKFGYEIIFAAAFLEGALVIDLFVPGASIVLLGALFSRTGHIEFPIYIACASAGFTLGFFIDYLLGFYGWSDIFNKVGLGGEIEKAQKRIKRYGGKIFFIGYFHPDLATVFAAAAGVLTLRINLPVFDV